MATASEMHVVNVAPALVPPTELSREERDEYHQLASAAGLRPGEAACTRTMLEVLRRSVSVKSEARSSQDEDEDDEELQKALALSMQGRDVAAPAPARSTSHSTTAQEQNFWAPPRYIPPQTLSRDDMKLSLRERIECRDGGFSWRPASAFLDTGNQHMTIVDSGFAARHGIYLPDGIGARGFSQAERWTTIRGVVPGASSKAPVVTVALRIRGQEYIVEAAVSEMHGEDVLLGLDVLHRLFASGFHISAGSV